MDDLASIIDKSLLKSEAELISKDPEEVEKLLMAYINAVGYSTAMVRKFRQLNVYFWILTAFTLAILIFQLITRFN